MYRFDVKIGVVASPHTAPGARQACGGALTPAAYEVRLFFTSMHPHADRVEARVGRSEKKFSKTIDRSRHTHTKYGRTIRHGYM